MTSSPKLAGKRIAIVGAGPIGLEAALYASALGADVRIHERGPVARHIGEWGHVQLFTPFGMNHTSLGRRMLEESGHELPGDDAFQSGAEWRETYLLPLAERALPDDALVLGASVVTIGRSGLLKGEAIGNGVRAGRPFRLLIERDGDESYEEADVMLDCSGSWANPNWLGVDGVPALGERESRDAIEYHPIDVAGVRRDSYAGRRTLLVGDGLSAATTVVALARLAAEDPGTQIVWVTRNADATPIAPLADDPLARRVQLTEAANHIAADSTSGCEWLPGSAVHSVRWLADLHHFEVVLETPSGRRSSEFDRVIANVGYEPDSSLYKELQVHECYASRGPMKLSASILAASADAGGDCLQLGGFGPEVLLNPEPGFFILGMKSYGRNSAFLLQTGHEQIRDAFRLITEEPELDLYADRDVTSNLQTS
jgi:thioredoxin reductase